MQRVLSHKNNIVDNKSIISLLKGQCYEIVDLRFFHEFVSPEPLLVSQQGYFKFFKIRGDIGSSRCTSGAVDTGGKWKKYSIRKVLIILFGHLWSGELTYRKVFSFKFTLRCQQSDEMTLMLFSGRGEDDS